MPQVLTVDNKQLEAMADRFAQIPGMRAMFVRRNLTELGRELKTVVNRALEEHRYTGALQQSLGVAVDGDWLEVGPTRKYGGGWDAGWILQSGTRPIARVPFEPIRRWAEFRGLPAGPVWYKIKTKGVSGHSWLEKVFSQAEFRQALDRRARAMGLTFFAYGLVGAQRAESTIVTAGEYGG